MHPPSESNKAPANPPRPRRQFSLRELFALTALAGLVLALATQWRHVGFVIAGYLVALSVGIWRKRSPLAVGSAAALLVFLITYVAAWVQLGSHEMMNSSVGRYERYRLHALDALLSQYRDAQGAYPASLADMKLADDTALRDEQSPLIDRWRRPFLYRPADRGYELLSLGPDGVRDGIDGDDIYSPASMGANSWRRMPIRTFLFNSNGSAGVFLAALIGSIFACSVGLASPPGAAGRWELTIVAGVLVIASSVIALFLASFYVLAGNSGH